MINKALILNYKSISEIRQETADMKNEREQESLLRPYKKIYETIHCAKEKGDNYCDIDPYWLEHDSVEEFFISEGYTIDEPLTTCEPTADNITSITTTVRVSW
jgi:hypothetical protein